MEMLANNTGIILFLVLGFGLFMAWGIGANDVANAMGTSVGSGALTLKQAIVIAAIFEFLGAFLAGGEVTSTIRKGIIDPAVFESIPDKFVLGMLSALLATTGRFSILCMPRMPLWGGLRMGVDISDP